MSFPIISGEISNIKTFHCPSNPKITDDNVNIIKQVRRQLIEILNYLFISCQVGCGLANGRQALQYFSLTSPELDIPVLTPPLAITATSLAALLVLSTLVFCACRQHQGKKRELRNKI